MTVRCVYCVQLLYVLVHFCALVPFACTENAPVSELRGARAVTVRLCCVVFQPRIAEENLTYAELELTKPLRAAKGVPTSTVYAQILFQENTL